MGERNLNESCSLSEPLHVKEIFGQQGVVFKSDPQEDDVFSNGILSIVEYSNGKYIKWQPIEVSEVATCEDEWAMVNTIRGRSRTVSGDSAGSQNVPQMRSQVVKIPLADVIGYKVSQKKMKLTIVTKEKNYDSFYFCFGNSEEFTRALTKLVKTKRAKGSRNYYLVVAMKPDYVPRSFSDITLGAEYPRHDLWDLISDFREAPYEATLSAFTRVTGYVLSKPASDNESPLSPNSDSFSSGVVGTDNEESYHIVTKKPVKHNLPPRPVVERSLPLSINEWTSSLDSEGRVKGAEQLKYTIFKGGVAPSIRHEVWKYLLGYYPWDSTSEQRQEIRLEKAEEYSKIKSQWKSISPDQEARFSLFRERKSLIEKDVLRADRNMQFFAGDNNPNLALLNDILMTYGMYNFDLGYVQGMSDILSPLLTVIQNEIDAFWCFVGFMNLIEKNFDMGEDGMKKQLKQLFRVMTVVAPELAEYLVKIDAGDLFFCFRWVIVWFKRELNYPDTMNLWEVLWTGLPCKNFHLLLCLSVLDRDKDIFIEKEYGFTEILAHVNGLANKMDINFLLREGEAIFRQLESAPDLKLSVKSILGLAPETDEDSNEDGSLVEPEELIDNEAACDQGLDLHFN